MEESSPIIKLIPGLKAKLLTIMIPIVVVCGILMIVMDRMDVSNTQQQNALTAGALLIAYCAFSFRGLNRYRIFLDLYPDKLVWRQGFKPFGKELTLKYGQVESLTISALTASLIFHLKPEASLPKELRLAPSFRLVEGNLAKPDVQDLENKIASNLPAIRDIYYLKYEIEKRKANQAAITKIID